MIEKNKRQSENLFIVDNSDSERKVLDYLHEWTQIPQNSLDIATVILKSARCSGSMAGGKIWRRSEF